MPETELKPCPFCGRVAVIKRNTDGRYYAMCTKCKTATVVFMRENKATEVWNRRVENAE